ETLLTTVHDTAMAQRIQMELLGIWPTQARLALRQGAYEQAEYALEEALTLTRTMPFPYAEAKALYVYGLLHVRKGEPEHAREKYEAALAICARLGERLYAEHVEQALAALLGRS